MGRPIDLARATTAHVADDELHRPADGGVRPIALAEHVHAMVHPDRPGSRTVGHDHRAHRHGGGEDPVDVERVGADRLDRGDHPREVLGTAPGHHRVDGDLLDRDLDQIGRHDGDDLVGGSGGALEHAQHPGLAGWDHGQAVGPAAVEQGLHLVLEPGQFHPPRPEPRPREPSEELIGEVGVDALGTTARPEIGQVRTEIGETRQLLPRPPGPPDGAVDLLSAGHLQERRYRLDAVVPAHRQLPVVDRGVAGGERRVVLAHDGQGAGFGQLGEHRHHEGAGGTIALHDDDESVGQGRRNGRIGGAHSGQRSHRATDVTHRGMYSAGPLP